MSYRDRINVAKKKYVATGKRLDNEYKHALKELYTSVEDFFITAPYDSKENVLSTLEEIADSYTLIDRGDNKIDDKEKKSDYKLGVWSGKIAAKYRARAGVDLNGILREVRLGNDKSAKNVLYSLESGRIKPGNPPRGKIGKILSVYKKFGYNPYNL